MLYQRAIAIIEKTLGPNHAHLTMGLVNYADLLDHLGRGKTAAEVRARAEDLDRRREATQQGVAP